MYASLLKIRAPCIWSLCRLLSRLSTKSPSLTRHYLARIHPQDFPYSNRRLDPHYARTTCCDRGDGCSLAAGKPLPQGDNFFPSSRNRRHRRQGGLRRKAHPEPLPSFADREAPRILYAPPLQRQASLDTINAATMRLCRADLPATADSSRLACPACPELVAGGSPRGSRSHSVPPRRATARREGRPSLRSRDGVSCIIRVKDDKRRPRTYVVSGCGVESYFDLSPGFPGTITFSAGPEDL